MKSYHFAKFVNPLGEVSALCFASPHAIDLATASWTIRPEAVTCPTCRQRLEAPKEP